MSNKYGRSPIWRGKGDKRAGTLHQPEIEATKQRPVMEERLRSSRRTRDRVGTAREPEVRTC